MVTRTTIRGYLLLVIIHLVLSGVLAVVIIVRFRWFGDGTFLGFLDPKLAALTLLAGLFLIVLANTLVLFSAIRGMRSAKKRMLHSPFIEQLKRDTRIFRGVVDYFSDAVMITFPHKIIAYVNPAWEQMTGYAAEEAIGRRLMELNLEEMDVQTRKDLKRAMRSRDAFMTDHIRYRRKDGSFYDCELKIFPVIEKGVLQCFVQIHSDISSRKRYERAKSEFVSLASHQLRTPLTAIRWAAAMLSGNEKQHLDSEEIDLVNTAHEASVRMAKIIKKMLSIASIESGASKPQWADVCVNELLALIHSDYQKSAESGGVILKVTCEENLMLRTDGEFLREVIDNLVSNAVKYTPSGGSVTLSAKKEAHSLHIEVEDSGYGIPQDQQSRVFSEFFRGANIVSLKTDSTGLGLYFVKLLVRLLEGEIAFTSEENEGTIFSLYLPLSPPAPHET